MLGKLIKHEFRATGRIMLPLAAAILALSVLAGVSVKVMDMPDMPTLANILGVTALVLFFLGLFGICVVAFVQMIERFYHNLLCDEGYLMFTLPTNPDALIFSKLIVSFVWFTVTGILCFAGMAIMLSISAAAFDWNVVGSLREALNEGLAYIGNGSATAGVGHIIGWVLELIILGFVGTAATCLRFYAAMAIGFSFDEHKKLLSVVFFFLIGIALNIIFSSLGSAVFNSGAFENVVFPNEFSPGAVHRVLLGMIATAAVTAGIYYLPTTLMLRKRLNLA